MRGYLFNVHFCVAFTVPVVELQIKCRLTLNVVGMFCIIWQCCIFHYPSDSYSKERQRRLLDYKSQFKETHLVGLDGVVTFLRRWSYSEITTELVVIKTL